jgi:hypothetical protein
MSRTEFQKKTKVDRHAIRKVLSRHTARRAEIFKPHETTSIAGNATSKAVYVIGEA